MDEYLKSEEFMQRINEVPVSAQLLIQSKILCSCGMDHGCSDLTTKAMALLAIVEDAQVEKQEISDTFTAITFRLEALERLELQENALLKAWATAAINENCGIGKEHFFKAAATEPLVADGDCPAFEPFRFAQRLLELSAFGGMA